MNPEDNYFGPCSDAVNRTSPDVLVRNEGTICVFTLLTPRAKAWFDANVSAESWQWFGASLVVEHRYALGLAAAMQAAGLILA